jgi:2-oxoglutarate dehydrogenase E1 component
MNLIEEFHGPNAAYVLELYERYRQDPQSVDPATRALFQRWTPQIEAAGLPAAVAGVQAQKVAAAVNLANAIRSYGYLSARLDPLGSPPPGDPGHEPEYHGLNDEDLRQLPAEIIGGALAEEAENALQAVRGLRRVYTTTTGYDYGHVQAFEEREWLREAAECGWFRPPQDPIDPESLLERLTQVEVLEQFLHRIYPGKTRFSIEGLDMLVPMLDELMGCAAEADICTVQIGMAHRGRLNVLAHILDKPYAQIFAEFQDPMARFPTRNELGWTGDVKYHKGARHAIQGGEMTKIVVGMAPNPSHLEHINPVVVGMARGAGSKADQPGPPEFFPDATLPVLIHGDASFTAQGVVAETLNLSRLKGYTVGGALHIIANNQIGYTTLPEDGRSTLFASDLAKGFEIPIIHVNADDPQGCLEAMRTAFEYRQKFGKDFLIDLIGYRRYGHNEGDEPAFTQPRLYQTIEEHPSVRKIWAQHLVGEGLVEADLPEQLVKQRMDELQAVHADLDPQEQIDEPELAPPPRGAAKHVNTAVSLEFLKELNQSLLDIPADFNYHRKLTRAMKRRKQVFEQTNEASIDWATAEELAFASILADGTAIRLTGEDVERGTFSQRHAVFHSTDSERVYIPLQTIPQAKASFEIENSPLSENAALGFEFGYNVITSKRLVIWEAQYGDFVNTAQTMIDEFIVSARAKWEQTPSLVMLLPHGMEGQGPDHSSGRPERFLQLAADFNLRLANCTSAAQYFHLLRRQAALLETDPLPLIILTPKSLLRNPHTASTPREVAEGRWQPLIDDEQAQAHQDQVQRLILCSGKVYVDLISSGKRQDSSQVAIARLEQLYPFPEEEVAGLLGAYPHLQEVLWVQEEPQNMGAWTFVAPRLEALIAGRFPLRYVGRQPNASPAEGSAAWHHAHQNEIISQAFDLDSIKVKEG